MTVVDETLGKLDGFIENVESFFCHDVSAGYTVKWVSVDDLVINHAP